MNCTAKTKLNGRTFTCTLRDGHAFLHYGTVSDDDGFFREFCWPNT